MKWLASVIRSVHSIWCKHDSRRIAMWCDDDGRMMVEVWECLDCGHRDWRQGDA